MQKKRREQLPQEIPIRLKQNGVVTFHVIFDFGTCAERREAATREERHRAVCRAVSGAAERGGQPDDGAGGLQHDSVP